MEKNIGAFLDLELPGSKVVVGGGPQLASLQRAYPKVTFTGPARRGAGPVPMPGADVFVFPSLTDTFGLVILEALACGTPVAAFPVTGPKDVLINADGKIGAVHTDLRVAALAALGRRPGRLPSPCRTIFLARLRRDFPVAPGAADGDSPGRMRHGERVNGGHASKLIDGRTVD